MFCIEALKTHGMQHYRLSHVATQQIVWLLLQNETEVLEVEHGIHKCLASAASHNWDMLLVPTQQLFSHQNRSNWNKADETKNTHTVWLSGLDRQGNNLESWQQISKQLYMYKLQPSTNINQQQSISTRPPMHVPSLQLVARSLAQANDLGKRSMLSIAWW